MFHNLFRKLRKSEDGPTAVEYAVMLALIVVVCLSTIKLVGVQAASKFQEIADLLAT